MRSTDKISEKEQELINRLDVILHDFVGDELDEDRLAMALSALVVAISAVLVSSSDSRAHLKQGVAIAATEIRRTCLAAQSALAEYHGETVN